MNLVDAKGLGQGHVSYTLMKNEALKKNTYFLRLKIEQIFTIMYVYLDLVPYFLLSY